VGEIAVKRDDDPLVFIDYWYDPEKTEQTTVGDWHLASDLAKEDEEGYYWSVSWAGDIIITSGYRVGPGEAADAILKHQPVQQVDVLSVPDDQRGVIIRGLFSLCPAYRTSRCFAGRYRSWSGTILRSTNTRGRLSSWNSSR
jgi:acetyl-CoA synthetase